jgi:hypothetical protein
MRSDAHDETVLAAPRWMVLACWIGFPVLGAGAGLLLQRAAGWVADLPWAPLQGPFKLVASAPQPYATIGALAVGGLGGLVLAFLAVLDSTTVTFSGGGVTIRRGDASVAVGRAAIGAVFLDGEELVVLGRAGEELAREKYDLGAKRAATAFTEQGLPWCPDGDPYREQYRRWVDDAADLPPGANAILKAREKALQKGDREDAQQLRVELGKLGVVVRDEKKRQFWRPAGAKIGR